MNKLGREANLTEQLDKQKPISIQQKANLREKSYVKQTEKPCDKHNLMKRIATKGIDLQTEGQS